VRTPVSRAMGNRLIAGITRDAMTVLQSLVDAEKEKIWRIGGHEFSDGAYQQLLRWLRAIQSPDLPKKLNKTSSYAERECGAQGFFALKLATFVDI
jgi:hypothetical protein